ncbi:ATP-binding protein [bacterium]|nr:ATP-binding protein [bacterium]
MIVSFTGAQSTGKTTLLNKIRDLNPNLNFIDEVTRRIKREYDLPINEDGGDITQSMIMTDHIANMYRKYDGDVILDRCAVDGVVYTHWLYDKLLISEDVFNWSQLIYNQLKSKYDVIFYTSPEDVSLVDDGERSIDVQFRNDIIRLFEERLAESDNVVRLSGTVEERLKYIKEVLDKKGLDIRIK